MEEVLVRSSADAPRILVQDDVDLLVEWPDSPRVHACRMTEGTGLRLTTEFPVAVDPEVRTDLQFLSENVLPLRANPLEWSDPPVYPGESLATGEASADGTPHRWAVGSRELPDDTMEFVNLARRIGADALTRAFRVVVWRYYPKGALDPLSPSASCSLDGGATWFALPVDLHGYTTVEHGIPRSATSAELNRIAVDLGDVPAAFPLLWEARSISSPSARLALTVTALEVGVKAFIARCVPGSEWLLENLQSPPVFKLLRDYLPTLTPPAGGHDRCEPPPAGILTVINKGVAARNALLHRGERISPADVRQLDWAVHYTLRLLDVYCGEVWAGQYMDAD